uniref:MFS domain-containing protein n=1 Tax=Caenorhabditis tropicalis TaxID=1561998 RepID=A0A1I7TQX2_9PELO
MVLYQITLVFSAQLIFVIFLDYMPPNYCNEDDFCYKLKSKCLTDYDLNAENLCSNNQTQETCIQEKKNLYFHSAQFEYQQDCTGLRAFPLSSVPFIGTLLGNILLGFLADKYGRRRIYLLSILFGIPCLVLSAAIKTIFWFYFFRFLTGIAISGTLTVGYTYAIEMMSPKRRLRLFALANWPNARIIQTGIAYLVQEWTLTTYISASIACLSLPLFWYLPESPIWYFYIGLAVYITDLNGADMTRNLYLGQFLAGLVLSIAQFIIGMTEPCLTRMGRRVLFLISQIIAILCYIIIILCLYLDWKTSFIYPSAYILAYASQSICLEAAYLSLVELMPTDVRATVGSMANICMKIGTLLATWTQPLKFVYEPSLFFINLVICIIGMILVFFCLEESREADMKMVGQKPIVYGNEEDSIAPGSWDSSGLTKTPEILETRTTPEVISEDPPPKAPKTSDPPIESKIGDEEKKKESPIAKKPKVIVPKLPEIPVRTQLENEKGTSDDSVIIMEKTQEESVKVPRSLPKLIEETKEITKETTIDMTKDTTKDFTNTTKDGTETVDDDKRHVFTNLTKSEQQRRRKKLQKRSSANPISVYDNLSDPE